MLKVYILIINFFTGSLIKTSYANLPLILNLLLKNREKRKLDVVRLVLGSIVPFFLSISLLAMLLLQKSFFTIFSLYFPLLFCIVFYYIVDDIALLLENKTRDSFGYFPLQERILDFVDLFFFLKEFIPKITYTLFPVVLLFSFLQEFSPGKIILFLAINTIFLVSSVCLIMLAICLFYKFFTRYSHRVFLIIQCMLTIFPLVSLIFYEQFFSFLNNNLDMQNFKFWYYLLPSSWFAAIFEIAMGEGKIIHYQIMAALSIPASFVVIFIYFKYVSITKILERLENLKSDQTGGFLIVKLRKLYDKVLSLFLVNREERGFYNLEKKMTVKNVEFIVSFSGILFMPIFAVYALFRGDTTLPVLFGKYYIYLTLILFFVFPSIYISRNFKAAWFFKVMGIQDVNAVYRGAYLYLLLEVITPVYLVVALILSFRFSSELISFFIYVYVNLLLGVALVFRTAVKRTPFSLSRKKDKFSILEALAGLLIVIYYVGSAFLYENICHKFVYLGGYVIVSFFLFRYFFYGTKRSAVFIDN